MIIRPRGKVAVILLLAAVVAAVIGGGILVRESGSTRREAMKPEAAARTPIIPGKALGPVQLGMSRQQVEASLGKPQLVQGTNIWSYNNPDISVMFSRDGSTVAALFAGGGPMRTSVPFKTEEGIGLGSTRDEIKAAWGEPDRQTGTGMTYFSRGIDMLFDVDRKLEWFCIRTYSATRPATAPISSDPSS